MSERSPWPAARVQSFQTKPSPLSNVDSRSSIDSTRSSKSHKRTFSFFSAIRPKHTPHQSQASAPTNASDSQLSLQKPQDQPMAAAPQPAPAPAPMQPPQQQTTAALPAAGPGPNANQPLHPEIRSILSLQVAHTHKIYFSGPLIRRIERLPDGSKPAKDEGWVDVWAQLGGTTLSIWDMRAINEASKKGEEVPPSYINVTDAFIQVLGSITIPPTPAAHGMPPQPPKKYSNILTLNTAGSNLILFSAPDTNSLISWAAALRLSAWEKSRLEEIYTAHLIRLTWSIEGRWKEPPSIMFGGAGGKPGPGKWEGSATVRLAGKVDWRPVWVVLTVGAGAGAGVSEMGEASTGGATLPRRISGLFGKSAPSGHGHSASVTSMSSATGANTQSTQATIYLYALPQDKVNGSVGSRRPKFTKATKPLLTITNVTQAFAVYPERPELIPASTLAKIEGIIGEEEWGGNVRGRDGWAFFMFDGPTGPSGAPTPGDAREMLRILTGVHDAFGLYGRPASASGGGYTWDPRDYHGLMFCYPIGEFKQRLFMDRELAEPLDPREDRTTIIRSRFKDICAERLRAAGIPPGAEGVPGQEQNGIPGVTMPAGSPPVTSPQLPPLDFGTGDAAAGQNASTFAQQQQQRPAMYQRPSTQRGAGGNLTPITERATMSERGTVDSASHYSTTPMDTRNNTGGDSAVNSPSVSTTMSPLSPARATGTGSGVLPNEPSAPPAKKEEGLIISRALSNSPVTEDEQPAEKDMMVMDHPLPPTPHSSSDLSTMASMVPSGMQSHLASSGHTPLTASTAIGSPQANGKTSFESSSTFGAASSKPMDSPRYNGGMTSSASGTFTPGTNRAQSPAGSVTSRGGGTTTGRSGTPNSPMQGSMSPVQPLSIIGRAAMSSSSSLDRVERIPAGSVERAGSPSPRTPNFGATGSVTPKRPTSPLSREVSYPVSMTDVSEKAGPSNVTSYFMAVSPAGPSTPEAKKPVGNGDYYHEEPRAVSVPAALSPTPQKRSNTPMMFDGHLTPGVPDMNSTSPTQREREPQSPMVEGGGMSTETAAERKTGLGRRPSGARPPPAPVKKLTLSDPPARRQEPPAPQRPRIDTNMSPGAAADDADADVRAALSYLHMASDSEYSAPAHAPSGPAKSPPKVAVTQSPNPASPAEMYPSSFAPSQKRVDRQARTDAAQAETHAVVSKPGRPNGGGKIRKDRGGWESSEEDDEEEEDEEEEEEELRLPPRMTGSYSSMQGGQGFSGSQTDLGLGSSGVHARPPRSLPALPTSRTGSGDSHGNARGHEQDHATPPPPRMTHEQQRMRSSPLAQERHATQDHIPQVPVSRQTMWSSVLDGGKPQPQSNTRDTFVNLDEDSHTMTKAFQPQGLLSAGIQDKEDRSAKRQEEMARESGASLINVPSKPPPPQTGLLGAITGYERDRKREGGVGAALTEREREKRNAETRQRELDDYQKQQLQQQQQMAQAGQTYSMYGAPGGTSPMSQYNPMMGGGPMMPPMMSPFGFPPMFANPQQMYAAQQAMQAYQQAMMAFSQAGSQIGNDTGNSPNPAPAPAANGNGNGAMSPNMMNMPMMSPAYDPRMSMMNMNMMMGGWDPRMSMFSPGMDMSPQQQMAGMPGFPLQPQMTGQSYGRHPTGSPAAYYDNNPTPPSRSGNPSPANMRPQPPQ